MNNSNKLKQITTVGIDLAKSSFQIHACDPLGNKLMNKKMTRPKLKEFIAQLKPVMVKYNWNVFKPLFSFLGTSGSVLNNQ